MSNEPSVATATKSLIRIAPKDVSALITSPVRVRQEEIGIQLNNPFAMVLQALCSCQEALYRSYAYILKIPIEDVKVNAIGKLNLRERRGYDFEEAPGFTDIYLEVSVTGCEQEHQLQQLREMVERSCPILNTLVKAIPVRGEVNKHSTKKKESEEEFVLTVSA